MCYQIVYTFITFVSESQTIKPTILRFEKITAREYPQKKKNKKLDDQDLLGIRQFLDSNL